jgi:hypothetical protein
MQDDVTNAPVAEEAPQETDPAISKDMPAVEAPEQQQAEGQQESPEVAPVQEAPAENAPSQTVPEESSEPVDWSRYVPNVQAPLPVDENGQVDPQQYRDQLKSEMRFEQNEIRTWQKLEAKHPEIGQDEGLRQMILANRLFDVQQGGKGTLEDSANRVLERFSIARNQGKADQQTSITVQKSAALAQPTGSGQANSTPDLSERIARGDQGAIQSTLSQWIKDGKV